MNDPLEDALEHAVNEDTRPKRPAPDTTCDEETALRPEHLRAVRLGHGANCSSVGSVIDTLFVSAAVGGAIFAAVCAALRDGARDVRVVGEREPSPPARAEARTR